MFMVLLSQSNFSPIQLDACGYKNYMLHTPMLYTP